MTTHTQVDLERLSSQARREFPHSHMSDTKWRKLFTSMAEAGVGLFQMIVKFIDCPEAKVMNFPSSGALYLPEPYIDTPEFGPIELRSIEWLDIPAIARFPRLDKVPVREVTQNLLLAESVLRHLNCNIEVASSGIRVVGYSR